MNHDEQKDVNQGLNQWIPSLWASYSTPINNLLANPAKNAIIGGALTTTVCALLAMFSRPRTRAIFLPASLVFGAIGGILTYFERRQQNDNILDVMKRLPPGSTKRDLLSDPAYQADLDRKAQQNSHHHYWY